MNLTVTRGNGYVQVRPAPPYLVDYLKYSHRSFETVNYRRVNKYETRLLHRTDDNGGLITLPGFYEKLCSLIHKNGDTFQAVDLRDPLPEIDWEMVKKIGPRDYQVDEILEFLFKVKDNSGIACMTGGWGKTHMQMMTYAAFNSLNTILAIPLKEVFNQTYRKFVEYFPDKHIGRVGDGYSDISTDITITTFKSLEKCAMEKCQLLLVDEIQGTTGDRISEVLTKMSPRRVLGYTATDKGLFNNADKVIKGLFGERLTFVPYNEAEASEAVVPGLVYMVNMPENTMSVNASSLEGKISQGIKNCQRRNQLIGDICRLIPDGWQTLIFVDHILDHLRKLHKELPEGTQFIHRESSVSKAGPLALSAKRQKEIIASFCANEFQYLMATDAFRAGVDVPNCRVVVQASGGSSEIEILQEAFRGSRTLSKEKQEELGVDEKTHFVLIDIMDTHDEKLEGMSYKRMEIYRKQGWKIKRVKQPEEIDWKDYKQEKTL